MANEAFALSPMSARAAEPNEQDYDAIREAFMETARGRWFLGEYARRNRNADTSMVLDAVARIEETLAAQRQPVVVDRLPEALMAIRRAVREAETIAIGALDPAAIETSLSSIHRGVRIIKEISWRWREIGADGRICDLIDSQLAAIEAACGQVSTIDPRTELKAAFDLLRDKIEETETGEAATAEAAAPPVRPASARAPEPPAAEETLRAAEAPPAPAEEPAAAFAADPDLQEVAEAFAPDVFIAATDSAVAADVAGAAAEPESAEVADSFLAVQAEVAVPAQEDHAGEAAVEELSVDATAEAEDEALLEMVAFEMAAPDPHFDEAPVEEAAAEIAGPAPAPLDEPVAAEIEETVASEPISAEWMAPASAPLATADAAAATLERPAEAVHVSPLPMPSPLPEQASLGATILASGLLQRPRTPANDPLAPIRRMTQAEKIAFFS